MKIEQEELLSTVIQIGHKKTIYQNGAWILFHGLASKVSHGLDEIGQLVPGFVACMLKSYDEKLRDDLNWMEKRTLLWLHTWTTYLQHCVDTRLCDLQGVMGTEDHQQGTIIMVDVHSLARCKDDVLSLLSKQIQSLL